MPWEINTLLARPSHKFKIELHLPRCRPHHGSVRDYPFATFDWLFGVGGFFNSRFETLWICSGRSASDLINNDDENTQLKKFQPQSIDDWADAGNKKRQLSSRSVRPDCRVHQTETEKKKKKKSKVFLSLSVAIRSFDTRRVLFFSYFSKRKWPYLSQRFLFWGRSLCIRSYTLDSQGGWRWRLLYSKNLFFLLSFFFFKKETFFFKLFLHMCLV